MGLFNLKKKAPQLTNSFGESLDKLTNGELPFGWIYKHKDYYKPKDDLMTAIAVQIRLTKEPTERIQHLQNLIDYFYSYKAECETKGECFKKYFEDYWMHCHNRNNVDFVYIKPYEDELNKLKGGL